VAVKVSMVMEAQWHHGKEVKTLWTAVVENQKGNDSDVIPGTRITTEERKRRFRKIRVSEKDILMEIHSSESTSNEAQIRVSKNAFRGSRPKITIHIMVTSANHILLENTAGYPAENSRRTLYRRFAD